MRLNGNRATWEINTEHGAQGLQDGGRIPNTNLLLSIFSLTFCLFFLFSLKHLDLFLVLQLVFKEKREEGKKTSNMKVTLLALGYMPCHFLANPTKAAGGSSKFLGRADNVEMLTTANLSRVSDLRTTAGDREQARE